MDFVDKAFAALIACVAVFTAVMTIGLAVSIWQSTQDKQPTSRHAITIVSPEAK